MAKQSFKDFIFKFLKKDENLGAYGGVKQNPSKRFKVKFAMPSKPNNIAVAAYQFEKDAEKFKKDVIAKGGKAILTKEESTPMGGKFIVRFKRGDQKPVQAIFDTKAQADAYEKEKRRMGFEIVEDLNQDDEKVIKKVKDMLKGASAKHAAQAKMIDKALKDEAFTKKDFDKNEDENDHTLNAVMLAKEFGSSKEIKDMEDIDKRHRQRGHISEPDYSKRNALVKKYYPRLK